MENKNIIIATGGTGGHILPAVVLARKLKKEKYNVLIIGDKKIENFIQNDNLEYKIIPCGKKLLSITSLFSIFIGFILSFFTILKFKPKVVIGFGCYATLPTLMAAKLLKKTIFLHEQNSHMGKINKLFSNDAKYIFTSFYEVYGININNADKVEFTGNPVRDRIKELNAINFQYPENEFAILITGGSGGASFFSEKLVNSFKYLPNNIKSKLKVFHQVKLKSELDKIKDFYDKQHIKARVALFFPDMPEILKNVSLVISRSGVGIASELSVAGKPTIFIPSPNVANNHQYYNAEYYYKNNACILINEKDFNEKNFSKTLAQLIEDKNKLEQLSNNMKKLAIVDAESKIYDFIKKEYNGN